MRLQYEGVSQVGKYLLDIESCKAALRFKGGKKEINN